MFKYLSAIILSMVVSIAIAAKAPAEELEARNGDTVIRIAGTPCTNKTVLENLKPEYHSRFKKAEVRNAGKPTQGCWTMDSNGVYIMLENGDQGYIPPEVFKPVETL